MLNRSLTGKFFLATILSLLSALALAQTDQSLRGKLSQAIEVASGNQLQIMSINRTPLGTIFEVELNTGEILYADISGDYLFAGDMYATTPSGLSNVSSTARQNRALEKIAAIPETEMIVFTPNEVKATITVFTDVDCTYCRKLHGDMPKLMDHGIQVRYLAYPRGGENAASYDKMISVWCADDRHDSLTKAKNDELTLDAQCETPVLAHYQIGNELGISGTPALVFEDGRVVPGYMDSDRLAAMLNLN